MTKSLLFATLLDFGEKKKLKYGFVFLLFDEVLVIISFCIVIYLLLVDDFFLVLQVLKDLSISLLLTLV